MSSTALQPRWDVKYARLLVVAAGLLLLSMWELPAFGGVYECVDAAGSRIFTDRPAQLRQCMPVPSTNTSSPSAVPAPVMTVPAQQVESAPPAFMAQPDLAQHATSAASGTPTPSCMPGVNPLNPMAAPPCRPPLGQPPAGAVQQ